MRVAVQVRNPNLDPHEWEMALSYLSATANQAHSPGEPVTSLGSLEEHVWAFALPASALASLKDRMQKQAVVYRVEITIAEDSPVYA